MSNSVSTLSAGNLSADEPRLIQQRFSLRRRMAQTALADVYWANDLHGISPTVPESIVLLLMVTPALAGVPDFAQGWQQLMSRPAPAADAYPDILAHGEDRGIYWLACRDIKGTLLSEFIQGLGENGLPTDQALDMVDAMAQSTASIQAGAYGYLEPGAILRTDQGYKILNAPMVKIIHQLISRNNAGSRHPLSLHSSYLSPSVAVGDVPIQEDDTFSIACILHALFTGTPPYGFQSTLAAAARADLPNVTNRFKPETQDILNSALALQRNQRPESPEALLQAIRRKSKRKLLFPLAVLTAAGIVTYASYHLLNKVGNLLNEPPRTAQAITPETSPAPEQESQPAQPTIIGAEQRADTPETATLALANEKPLEETNASTPEASQNTTQDTTQAADAGVTSVASASNSTAPATDTQASGTTPDAIEGAQTTPAAITPEPAPPPAPTESAPAPEAPPIATMQDQQAEIRQLLTQAENAIAANQLESANNTPGAIELLRQAWVLDRENATTRNLLNQVLRSKQQQAESLISRSRLEEAKQALAENDEFMREFLLTDLIQEQIKLENRIEVREREQEQARTLLEQARAALKRGQLTKEDHNTKNALEYLTKLMFMLPNHAEGRDLLEQIVRRRQQTARTLLGRGELEQAGTYLGETERLIRKYNLSGFKGTQTTLDKGYRRAVDQAAAPRPREEPVQTTRETVQATEQPQAQPQPQVQAPPRPRPAAQNRVPQPRVVYTPAPAAPAPAFVEQHEQGETVLLPPPENSDPMSSREIIALPVEPMPNEAPPSPPVQDTIQVQVQPAPQGQSLDEMTLEQRVLQTRQQPVQQPVRQQQRQQPAQFQQPEPPIETEIIQPPVPMDPVLEQAVPVQQIQPIQPMQSPEEMTLEQRVLQARQANRAPQPAPEMPVLEYVPFVEDNPNAPTLEPMPFDDQLPANQ